MTERLIGANLNMLAYWDRTGPMKVQYDKLTDHMETIRRILIEMNEVKE